jgi:hypothetical protein
MISDEMFVRLQAALTKQPPIFLAITFLRKFCQICTEIDHPVFTSLDFKIINILQSKVVSIASNTQPGEPGPCM